MTAPNPQQGQPPTQQPANTQQGGGQPAGGQLPQPPQLPQGPPADQPQSGQVQQQANPWQGLLDVGPPQGGQQQQGMPQYGQQPGQQFAQQYGPPAQPVGMDPTQIADLVSRVIDRRVNQLANPQWQQAHGQPGPQSVTPQGPPQQPQYVPPAAPAGPADADQREARMAATAYLGDQIQFGSAQERAMAVDLTSALIPGQLLMGFTPNQAGLAVAQQVAQRVTELRRSYEDQAVRGLRARGLLVEPQQGPAQMAGSVGVPLGGTPAPVANQHKAAARHNQMQAWATEENTQRGWDTKAATPATG